MTRTPRMDLPTYAEMQNILTQLKHANEQLRRQVTEIWTSKKLLQIKIGELVLAAKTSQLNTKINKNLERTPTSNTSVPKDVNVISKSTQNSNKTPTNKIVNKYTNPHQ